MSRFLICSFALVLLYPAGIDMYLVGLPRIAADLNASEAQLHIAFSVYLAGMAAAMLFAGKVADRSGRKPVAIPGAALFIIASVFCSLAETSTLFLAGRFLQGLGAGCCYVVAFAILRDTLDDRRRAKVLSLLNGITCIIPVLAAGITLAVSPSHAVSLFGITLICAGFSVGFGVAMSQALGPFSLRAGVASSTLGIAQVCGSSLWIWLAAVVGIGAWNMLIGILIACSIVSLLLIMFVAPGRPVAAHEEIHHHA
ncbi:MFS transporter [Escherichia coli]|nr:MFS transporter [Escherichia coli]ELJ4417351.1 MFS transporter [Escherichia coli]